MEDIRLNLWIGFQMACWIHDLLSNEVLSNEVLSNEVLSKALFGHIIETHQNGYFYRNCILSKSFFLTFLLTPY